MAFTEDINTFFGDFSENVFYDNETYKGILEQPDEVIADGVVLTTDYELTVKTTDLGTIAFDTQIEVSNVKYKVRNVRKIDDGTLSKISNDVVDALMSIHKPPRVGSLKTLLCILSIVGSATLSGTAPLATTVIRIRNSWVTEL